jgi:hypothetical protein
LLVIFNDCLNPHSYITLTDRFEIGVATVVVAETDEEPSILHGIPGIELGTPAVKVGETEV